MDTIEGQRLASWSGAVFGGGSQCCILPGVYGSDFSCTFYTRRTTSCQIHGIIAMIGDNRAVYGSLLSKVYHYRPLSTVVFHKQTPNYKNRVLGNMVTVKRSVQLSLPTSQADICQAGICGGLWPEHVRHYSYEHQSHATICSPGAYFCSLSLSRTLSEQTEERMSTYQGCIPPISVSIG